MRKGINKFFRRHFLPNIPKNKHPGYNLIVISSFHSQEAFLLTQSSTSEIFFYKFSRVPRREPTASCRFLLPVVHTLQR